MRSNLFMTIGWLNSNKFRFLGTNIEFDFVRTDTNYIIESKSGNKSGQKALPFSCVDLVHSTAKGLLVSGSEWARNNMHLSIQQISSLRTFANFGCNKLSLLPLILWFDCVEKAKT